MEFYKNKRTGQFGSGSVDPGYYKRLRRYWGQHNRESDEQATTQIPQEKTQPKKTWVFPSISRVEVICSEKGTKITEHSISSRPQRDH